MQVFWTIMFLIVILFLGASAATKMLVLGVIGVVIALALLIFWHMKRVDRRKDQIAQQEQHNLVEAWQAKLLEKYSSPDIVERIISKSIWEGMTKEQLLDSRGPPKETNQKITKKRITEVYKYDQYGKNRFRLKVTLSDDVVTGWEKS